jgi:histidinol-phosphate/aromatic aminotransferase/cobyric acid decarboxylase-like protein
MAAYRLPEYVRVTVGTAPDNRKFIGALEKALRKAS